MTNPWRASKLPDAADREKIIAMKKRRNADGSRRFTSEDIAAYTGFPLSQVRICNPDACESRMPRSRSPLHDAEPLGFDEEIEHRQHAVQASRELLAALQRVSA